MASAILTKMSDNRPNVILFMTDQQRGDCLGIEGHPVLQTPYLDEVAANGIRCRKGYSACPVCIPARRTLMSGTRPATHGVLCNHNADLPFPTLPGELATAGYQTHLVGKLHLHPERKRYGFGSSDWADSPVQKGHQQVSDDYQQYLLEQGLFGLDRGMAHGANQNGWAARPFHLDERHHFSTWCADRALRFLERRDPTAPFFLKVSFHQPHQPVTPPQVYWDRYIDADLPEMPVADWARIFDGPQLGQSVCSWRTQLTPAQQRQFQAGYYGCINHIDDQIGRVLTKVPGDTIICFVSDHGEMLGQHQWIRKRSPYEGSARVPFLLNFPRSTGIDQGKVLGQPVELMDLMPTILDACGVEIPDTVDGSSLMPLLRGESSEWRQRLHGECSALPGAGGGMQYLTDGRLKYIWFPGTGLEQLFDTDEDPDEMTDLARQPAHGDTVASFRAELIGILADRPEGFVRDGELAVLGGNTPACIIPG